MRISKAIHRYSDIQKRKSGHKIDNRNIFLLEEIRRKKAEKAKRKMEKRLHKEEEVVEEEDD
jgi:hypothetical protein